MENTLVAYHKTPSATLYTTRAIRNACQTYA